MMSIGIYTDSGCVDSDLHLVLAKVASKRLSSYPKLLKALFFKDGYY